MPNIEDQLRRYGDAVESTYGQNGLPDVEFEGAVSPLDRLSPDRRRYAPLLVAAAVLAAVVGSWTIRDRTTEIITPAVTTSTTVQTDSARGDETKGRLEVGHPQLLPPSESWVLTDATLSEYAAPNVAPSEVLAFEHPDGRLSILVVSPLSGEEQPLAGATIERATIERQYNRAILSWSGDDSRLVLMTFDADDQQLRSDADQLARAGTSYVLPGTVKLTADNSEQPQTGQQSTMVFSATSDGDPDPASFIEQMTIPGTTSELFRTLFEASDLGTMNRLEVEGRTAYLVTSEFDQYGLTYSDGQVITWQGSTAQVDLTGFVSSLLSVGAAELESAVVGAEQLRLDAIDEALAASEPDPSETGLLPRFVLDTPWQLDSVFDPSLWTAEQRAEYKVTMESATSQGQVETGRIWFQYFAASDNPEDGLVILEAREATISPATITGGSPTDRPITVLGYEGILGEFDRYRLISVRKGTTSLEIMSGRLTADELVAFADRLIDRNGDGLTGFDLSDDAFTTIAEGAAPPVTDEPAETVDYRRYNQLWTLDGKQVRVSVWEIVTPVADVWPPAEFNEAHRSALGTPPPSLVPGTPFTASNDAGRDWLTWENESAGVRITIMGDTGAAGQAAESIQTISEAEWQALAKPAAITLEEALDPVRPPLPDE